MRTHTCVTLWCFAAALLLTAFAACQPTTHNIRGYYLPDDAAGKLYIYALIRPDTANPAATANPDQPLTMTWGYERTTQPKGWLSTRYDAAMNAEQVIREEDVANGMIATHYTLVRPDSSGAAHTVAAHIAQNVLFPFEVRDNGGIFVFSLSFPNPTDPAEAFTVTHNRHFSGFRAFTLFGTNYPDCVEMLTKSKVVADSKTQGGFDNEFITTDIYARGIGLIYTRRELEGGIVTEYGLKERRTNVAKN